MEERRRYLRIPAHMQILYEVLHTAAMKEQSTKDISQGGIRFMVHEFIPKNSQMKVRLTLSRTSFTFEAIVQAIWISEMPYGQAYEVGVKFIDIPVPAANYLINYIKASLRIGVR